MVTGIETLWAKNHHLHNHAFIQSMLVFKQGQKSVECLLMSTTRIFNLINIMQYLYQMSILTIVLLLRRLIDVKSLFKPIVKQGFEKIHSTIIPIAKKSYQINFTTAL